MNSGGFDWLINLIASPVQRLYQLILRIIPGLRKLPSLPLPTLLALIAFVFLLIVYVAAVLRYYYYHTALLTWPWHYWLIAFAGVCVIPIFVYFLVKFWLIQEQSPYPEIDRLWQHALKLCGQKEIDLKNLPIYLVLGGKDAGMTENLLHAAQYPMEICLPEKGQGDVGFYANKNAVFIAMHGCSYLSGLVGAQWSTNSTSGTNADSENTANPGGDDGGTISPEVLADLQFTVRQKSGDQSRQNPADQSENVQDTIHGGPGYLERILKGLGADAPSQMHGPLTTRLDSSDIATRSSKLEHVCGLIERARSPVCPVNGLLSLLPFELVERGGDVLQVGFKQDLQYLRRLLKIRCPLMVLVTETDLDGGFQEMIRRLPPKTVQNSRFGLGHEVWSAAKPDRVRAVAAHATAAFEEWVYTLFQKDDALKQKFNSRLLRLLCRTRGVFNENLQNLLASACSYESAESPDLAREQFLFAGCYFAQINPKKPAFIKSVVHKLIQLEAELEWAPAARARDRELQFFASLFALLGFASLATIVGIAIWKLIIQQPE